METLRQVTELLVKYQNEIVIVLASLGVSGIAKQFPAFADLGNWWKRGVLLVAALIVSLAVELLGGTPGINLADLLVNGTIAGTVAATNFKIARTTPTTKEAAEIRKENL